jgi:transcriptional regulator with XRE-family HTH domain
MLNKDWLKKTYNYLMDFKTWLWEKYDAWRKGTNRGVTEFAAHLGVGQPSVTGWLKGNFTPGAASLKKLAKVYPDVYEAFGLPPSDNRPKAQLPPPLQASFDTATAEINSIYASRHISIDSPEALAIATEVLGKYGFTVSTATNISDDE